MPLTAFISAVGFLGAIIILRAGQWVWYKSQSNCITTTYVGLIWSYSAVLIGILAIVSAFMTSSCADRVNGVPIAFFVAMTIMAAADLLAPISSSVFKAFKGRDNDVSWLDSLDEERIGQKNNNIYKYRVVGKRGKAAILIELALIITILQTVLFFYIVWSCCWN